MATTTRRYLCHPVLASGPTVTTGATAWTFTGWTEVVAANAIASTFYVAALNTLIFPTAAVDVRHSTVFSLGVGGAGAEVEIAQFPATWMVDTAAGHVGIYHFVLPEPREVAANSRVAVRVAHSAAVASTFGPFKIQYQVI